MNSFAALVLSLPTRNSTVRMRVWRALKATGCGALRDGVYVLPKEAPTASGFAGVEDQVRAAGGFAAVVDLGFTSAAQLDSARGLFDRSAEYGKLVARMDGAKSSIVRLGRARRKPSSSA